MQHQYDQVSIVIDRLDHFFVVNLEKLDFDISNLKLVRQVMSCFGGLSIFSPFLEINFEEGLDLGANCRGQPRKCHDQSRQGIVASFINRINNRYY